MRGMTAKEADAYRGFKKRVFRRLRSRTDWHAMPESVKERLLRAIFNEPRSPEERLADAISQGVFKKDFADLTAQEIREIGMKMRAAMRAVRERHRSPALERP
jgi:hypothetical protein